MSIGLALAELRSAPADTLKFGFRNRRAAIPSAEELMTLPLHFKPVKCANVNFLADNFLNDYASKRVRHLLELLEFNPKAPGHRPPEQFQMPDAHADQLLQMGVLEDLGHISDVKMSSVNTMLYFCVKELRESGARLRPIMCPKSILELSDYVSQHVLHRVDEYRRMCLIGGEAATFDLAASFVWYSCESGTCQHIKARQLRKRVSM